MISIDPRIDRRITDFSIPEIISHISNYKYSILAASIHYSIPFYQLDLRQERAKVNL